MFEKVKKGVKRLKNNVTEMKAKSRDMTKEEYEGYVRRRKAKEKTERAKYDDWKIEEKYRQKRSRDKKKGVSGSGLTKLFDAGTTLGRNFAKNVTSQQQGSQSDFNSALLGGSTKKRRKKKKKRKVVVYV